MLLILIHTDCWKEGDIAAGSNSGTVRAFSVAIPYSKDSRKLATISLSRGKENFTSLKVKSFPCNQILCPVKESARFILLRFLRIQESSSVKSFNTFKGKDLG